MHYFVCQILHPLKDQRGGALFGRDAMYGVTPGTEPRPGRWEAAPFYNLNVSSVCNGVQCYFPGLLNLIMNNVKILHHIHKHAFTLCHTKVFIEILEDTPLHNWLGQNRLTI